jgi:hypothetical protein
MSLWIISPSPGIVVPSRNAGRGIYRNTGHPKFKLPEPLKQGCVNALLSCYQAKNAIKQCISVSDLQESAADT